MTQGLSTSSSTFKKIISNVFRGLNWLILFYFLDDVLVHSQAFVEHLSPISILKDYDKQF